MKKILTTQPRLLERQTSHSISLSRASKRPKPAIVLVTLLSLTIAVRSTSSPQSLSQLGLVINKFKRRKSPQCLTFDEATKTCTICRKGYYMYEGPDRNVCKPCSGGCNLQNCKDFVGCTSCRLGFLRREIKDPGNNHLRTYYTCKMEDQAVGLPVQFDNLLSFIIFHVVFWGFLVMAFTFFTIVTLFPDLCDNGIRVGEGSDLGDLEDEELGEGYGEIVFESESGVVLSASPSNFYMPPGRSGPEGDDEEGVGTSLSLVGDGDSDGDGSSTEEEEDEDDVDEVE